MTDEKFHELENALISADNSFGVLCTDIIDDYDDEDALMGSSCYYSLYVFSCFKNRKSYDNGKSLAVGYGFELACAHKNTLENIDELIVMVNVSADEIINIFYIFTKHNRELICDLYNGPADFSLDNYISRLRKLNLEI